MTIRPGLSWSLRVDLFPFCCLFLFFFNHLFLRHHFVIYYLRTHLGILTLDFFFFLFLLAFSYHQCRKPEHVLFVVSFVFHLSFNYTIFIP
jgi:hypothetical protein